MSTSSSTLNIAFPDGRAVQCVRVDGEYESPAYHDIHLDPGPASPSTQYYSEGSASIVLNISHGSVSGTSGAFIPPRPLPSRVFVKWAERGDATRAKGLAREASFCTQELKELQGGHVPKFYGHYVSQLNLSLGGKTPFVPNVFELCEPWVDVEVHDERGGGNIMNAKIDPDEYFRQYMLAICAIHQVGVVHNQLGLTQRTSTYAEKLLSFFALNRDMVSINIDHHVLPIRLSSSSHGNTRPVRHPIPLNGTRTQLVAPVPSSRLSVYVLDFTQAQRHKCNGAQLRIEGSDKPMYFWRRINETLGIEEKVENQLDDPCLELNALEECSALVTQQAELLLD